VASFSLVKSEGETNGEKNVNDPDKFVELIEEIEHEIEEEIEEHVDLVFSELADVPWSIKQVFKTRLQAKEFPQLQKFRGGLGLGQIAGMRFTDDCRKGYNAVADTLEGLSKEKGSTVYEAMSALCKTPQSCIDTTLEYGRGIVEQEGERIKKLKPTIMGGEVDAEDFLNDFPILWDYVCTGMEEIMK